MSRMASFNASMVGTISRVCYLGQHTSDTDFVLNVGMDSIASRLRHARALRSLNQTQLAKLAGVRQSAISNIESGIRTGLQSLQPIAQALSVRYEWLRDGMEPMLAQAEPELFSRDLLQAIRALPSRDRRRLENQLRAAVDLAPLPPLSNSPELGESTPATGTHNA